MTDAAANGRRARGRAGIETLSLLAAPVNVFLLQALGRGPRSLADLRREVGSPPQTTMRRQLRLLTEMEVLAKRRQSEFPGALDYELTPAGQALLRVADVLKSWLQAHPGGQLELGSVAARNAIGAMVEGWETNILRVLAAKPLSLTALANIIPALSYPSLERRLTAMRLAGQIEPSPAPGRGTPYTVTNWLRRGAGPIAAAAHWETAHLDGRAGRATSRDIEAGFLLGMPLTRVPEDLSGSCRLAIDTGSGERHRLAGVIATFEQGQAVSCSTRLDGHPDAWIVGPFSAWLHAVVGLDVRWLEIGGDGALASAIVEGLNRALYRDLGSPEAGPVGSSTPS